MGIPKEKIVAIDLENPTHMHPKQRKFWEITLLNNYEIKPYDILFVAWGSGIGQQVNNYAENGGKCVILLGETKDGCTFPSDYFIPDKYDLEKKEIKIENPVSEWESESHHVIGPASQYSEYLTVNIRK